MEIIIKRKKSVLDLNFNGFIQEEKELTDKKIKILERKNKNYLDDNHWCSNNMEFILFRAQHLNSKLRSGLWLGKSQWAVYLIFFILFFY